jgi:excisionase family DNA binding protein
MRRLCRGRTRRSLALNHPLANGGATRTVDNIGCADTRPVTLMSVKQAAHYYGVSVWTVYRWLGRGVGPECVVYPGSRRRYFTKDALDSFIEKHTRRRNSADEGEVG